MRIVLQRQKVPQERKLEAETFSCDFDALDKIITEPLPENSRVCPNTIPESKAAMLMDLSATTSQDDRRTTKAVNRRIISTGNVTTKPESDPVLLLSPFTFFTNTPWLPVVSAPPSSSLRDDTDSSSLEGSDCRIPPFITFRVGDDGNSVNSSIYSSSTEYDDDDEDDEEWSDDDTESYTPLPDIDYLAEAPTPNITNAPSAAALKGKLIYRYVNRATRRKSLGRSVRKDIPKGLTSSQRFSLTTFVRSQKKSNNSNNNSNNNRYYNYRIGLGKSLNSCKAKAKEKRSMILRGKFKRKSDNRLRNSNNGSARTIIVDKVPSDEFHKRDRSRNGTILTDYSAVVQPPSTSVLQEYDWRGSSQKTLELYKKEQTLEFDKTILMEVTEEESTRQQQLGDEEHKDSQRRRQRQQQQQLTSSPHEEHYDMNQMCLFFSCLVGDGGCGTNNNNLIAKSH